MPTLTPPGVTDGLYGDDRRGPGRPEALSKTLAQ